jgi:hypothetical protein
MTAPSDLAAVMRIETVARRVFRHYGLPDGRDLHNRGGTIGRGALGAPVVMIAECPSERSVVKGGSRGDHLSSPDHLG